MPVKGMEVRGMLVYEVKEFPEEIEKARESANKKLLHTIDTWQKDRPCVKKWFDLFPGDFATRIVASFLLIHGIQATIYDDVREDGFKKSDLYDLKVGNIEIDVKSSLLKQRNVDSGNLNVVLDKIREMNIIAYPKKIKPVHIQVFFWLPDKPTFFDDIENQSGEPCSFDAYLLQKDEIKKYENEFIEKGVAVLAGWADKDLLVSASERTEMGNSLANTNRRVYKRLKLKEAYAIEELPRYLRAHTS